MNETIINYEDLNKVLCEGVFYTKFNTNFDELDPLNLLHNSRYLYILERATYLYFNAIKVIEDFDIVKYPDLHHVVYSINLNYIKPIVGVTSFLVSISPIKLREAGAIYEVAFLSTDKSTIYCKGTRAIAKVKPKTFEPISWTKKFRETHEYIINVLKKKN